MSTQMCSECQQPLVGTVSSRQFYCGKRCRDRAAQRRRRAGGPSESQVSQLKRHLEEARARVRVLETRLGQRNAQLRKWKKKRHVERLRRDQVSRDLHRARETIGSELVLVREQQALREIRLGSMGEDVDLAEVAKLRRENAELREDLEQSHQSVMRMRNEQDRRLEQLVQLNEENELFQAAASRMKIKSDVMFQVFGEWNVVVGWLYDATEGVGRTVQEQAVLDFWVWVHRSQPHLIERGRIETSFEDELSEMEQGEEPTS